MSDPTDTETAAGERAPTGDALIAHFKVCDCHDSWDQCPCADGGHPKDGSCGCCPFGIGLCGPLPAPVREPDEAAVARESLLLTLAQADGQPWASIVEASLHTAEMMYGKQADAVLASDWLAEYAAKARAEAWDEGYRSAAWKSYQRTGIAIDAPERAEPPNPYPVDGGAR